MDAKRHFLMGGGLALLAALGAAHRALPPAPTEAARVARVVDGD